MSTRLRRVCLGLAVLLALCAPAALPAQGNPIAIVVHPSTPIEDLSFTQLQRIFLGEQQYWSDESRITLLVRAPAAAERTVVLNRIYRMNEGQFRQYWIAKLFRAELASGPKIVYSSEMALELVNAIPGAITFVPASAVGPGAKMLRVDGKLPSDSGYRLR
jgi:ABC-type phosphate transport system substrate-binding protein